MATHVPGLARKYAGNWVISNLGGEVSWYRTHALAIEAISYSTLVQFF